MLHKTKTQVFLPYSSCSCLLHAGFALYCKTLHYNRSRATEPHFFFKDKPTTFPHYYRKHGSVEICRIQSETCFITFTLQIVCYGSSSLQNPYTLTFCSVLQETWRLLELWEFTPLSSPHVKRKSWRDDFKRTFSKNPKTNTFTGAQIRKENHVTKMNPLTPPQSRETKAHKKMSYCFKSRFRTLSLFFSTLFYWGGGKRRKKLQKFVLHVSSRFLFFSLWSLVEEPVQVQLGASAEETRASWISFFKLNMIYVKLAVLWPLWKPPKATG